ncbi:hypothetical protein L218DRAFT_491721 [Marasmius fiardii PR-910]|nr:hypothetical protein L218DRAFT_491721 [Marasmius fiardii PR-910]
MDFQRLGVIPDYGVQQLLYSIDPTSFGPIPPTPPRRPSSHGASDGEVYARSSYSDYDPPSQSVVPTTTTMGRVTGVRRYHQHTCLPHSCLSFHYFNLRRRR